MPTFHHGKSTSVYLDEFDMSAYLNSTDITHTQDTAETTVYGASSRAFIASQASGTLSFAGLIDATDTAGTSDKEFEAILGSATHPVLTVAIEGGTIGNRAVIARANETSYTMATPVADVNSLTADFQCSADPANNVDFGVASAVQLTTGASIAHGSLGNLASVDNGASSTNGGAALLHVPANTVDGATTIKVQHSADDAVWADLVTFTAVGASTITSQLSAVTGTVNQYLRVTASTAGSSGAITFMVSFARF
jgi:hypothetical protein